MELEIDNATKSAANKYLAEALEAQKAMRAASERQDTEGWRLAYRRHARSYRCLGEVIYKFEQRSYRHGSPMTRAQRDQSARLLGVSRRQRYLALRLSRIPRRFFEMAIFRDMPFETLEDMGRGHNYIAADREVHGNIVSWTKDRIFNQSAKTSAGST
ncbi:MAG: hypothetical protein KIS79_06275 [Burkholderiales bacterium]|nr:hypothetical protein [Burkholderiales bacterium]